MLKNPIKNEDGQDDKKQIRPSGNRLVSEAGPLHLATLMARLGPLLLGIGCPLLVWPFRSGAVWGTAFPRILSRFSAFSQIRVSTLIQVRRSAGGISESNSCR